MIPLSTQLIPDDVIAALNSIPDSNSELSEAIPTSTNQVATDYNIGASVAERIADVNTPQSAHFPATDMQPSDTNKQSALEITPPPPQPPRFIIAPVQPTVQSIAQSQVNASLFTMPPPQLITQQPVVAALGVGLGLIPPMYQHHQQSQQVGYQYYQQVQPQQLQSQLGIPQYPVGMNMIPTAMSQYGQMPILIPPPVVGDPMNDMSSWSEHESEDKRKYWYNRVNGTSTYDKPFCLKTPEERSIPHCKWKEYTSADDKKYYSDGKESRYFLFLY